MGRTMSLCVFQHCVRARGVRICLRGEQGSSEPTDGSQTLPIQKPAVAAPIIQKPIAPSWDRTKYERMVKALTEDQVRQSLVFASKNSTYLQKTIPFLYDSNKRREAARVIDFSGYMRDVLYILNEKYRSSSSSREYEMSFDAARDIETVISEIEEEAHPEVSWSNKLKALEMLLDIGDSIVEGDSSTLGSEVRKSFQRDSHISSAMSSIISSMTGEERRRVSGLDDDDVGLIDKVEDLVASADGYGMNMHMNEVLELLRS